MFFKQLNGKSQINFMMQIPNNTIKILEIHFT